LFFVEQNFLSHSIQLADALIGASVIVHRVPILTGNDRHYKAMPDIKIKKFFPHKMFLNQFSSMPIRERDQIHL